jgi:hypothetical protein
VSNGEALVHFEELGLRVWLGGHVASGTANGSATESTDESRYGGTNIL